MVELFVASSFNIFFIDGTVEGTDIYLLDNFGAHDHTYFGNGCPNSTTEGGSTKACSTKLVQTMDGETQEIGSIYNFQAATSGSGSALEEDNTNSPDTFCPLGWQLPYSGTGGDYYNQSRSWKYLLDSYGINTATLANARKILSYPISHIASGYYGFALGRLYGQTINDRHFSSDNYTRYDLHRLNVDINGTVSFDVIAKNFAYPLRCILGINNLEKLSMASA